MSHSAKEPHDTLLGRVLSRMVGSGMGKAGQASPAGFVAGAIVGRVARRSPLGAMLIGGALVARSLYRRKKERDEDERARVARPVKVVKPDSLPGKP